MTSRLESAFEGKAEVRLTRPHVRCGVPCGRRTASGKARDQCNVMPALFTSRRRRSVRPFQFDDASRARARLLLCFALMHAKLFLPQAIATGRRFAFRYSFGVLRLGPKSQQSRIGAR